MKQVAFISIHNPNYNTLHELKQTLQTVGDGL